MELRTVVLLRFVTGTLISLSLVNGYDVDDSILHRVTFAAGPAKSSMADVKKGKYTTSKA